MTSDDDPGRLGPSDPDVIEAGRDARALVTARMAATLGTNDPTVDALINDMVREALGAKEPQRAVAAQLATLATLASVAIDMAHGFLGKDPIPDVTRDDVREALFLQLDQADGTL